MSDPKPDLASRVAKFLGAMLGRDRDAEPCDTNEETNAGGTALPEYSRAPIPPERMTQVVHPDGRMSTYPPPGPRLPVTRSARRRSWKICSRTRCGMPWRSPTCLTRTGSPAPL